MTFQKNDVASFNISYFKIAKIPEIIQLCGCVRELRNDD